MIGKFLVISIGLLALISCSAASGQALTQADSGKSIELANGETFRITLPANPTTGFIWEPAPESAAPVALQGEPEYKADQPVLTGSGGQMTFTFKATASGQGLLKLVYHQPWDQGVPPVETFEVNVTIR